MEHSRLNSRVLLLYRTFGPSVNLCGFLQFQKLAEDGRIDFRHKRITEVKREDLNWAQIIAFVRGDGRLDELMAKVCHRAGKCVLYILDDDLLNVPLELGSGAYYAQKSVKRHIWHMLEYSDCFASPSPILLKKYGGLCKRSFLLIEPAAYCIKEKRPKEGGAVHIGFAGSSDRGNDVDQIISGALAVIKERYGKRVSLEFFGVKTQTAEQLGGKTYPYTESYEEYQRIMARLDWDIGLAPMPESDFHACKHYNKLVEYCGFGIVGVYSDLPPYHGAVEHGVTGLLCKNTTQAWVEALSRLIDEEGLRREMAQNCLERAAGAFSVETAARKMDQGLSRLELPADIKPVKGCLVWMKLSGMFSWYLEKFKKYGLKTPVIAVKKLAYLMKKEI